MWYSYHLSSSFPSQASLSLMLFPLLSKKWLIFAKSYYYRSMCYPIYEQDPQEFWPEEGYLWGSNQVVVRRGFCSATWLFFLPVSTKEKPDKQLIMTMPKGHS